MQENSRTEALPASATLGLAARAKELLASGRPVISMAVGEPDFNAPLAAQEAAARAAASGEVRYTPAAGTPALRAAIATHLTRDRHIPTSPEQVVVGHSCKHMLATAFLALLNPREEVLLFAPAWNSYEAQIQFAGGQTVWIPPQTSLAPDFDAIQGAITPRTRGMVLNSPSNPSGYVWKRSELGQLARIAEEHDLWIIVDEIYQRLVYADAEFVSIATLSKSLRERIILVDGASKAYAMTGYRIGFAAAPPKLANALTRLNSQLTGCPNYLSQMAYLAVLETEPPEVQANLDQFQKRRDLLVEGLRALGMTLQSPGGAFYAFPNIGAHLGNEPVDRWCARLLEEANLATVPGTIFDCPSHVRMSYALGQDEIREALARLRKFLEA